MTDDEFAALVARIETLGREHPGRYRIRVALLAILAYAYLGLILTLTVSAALALAVMLLTSRSIHGVAIQVLILLLLFAATIVRALWVKLAAPEGRRVTAQDAPELFRLIEDVRVAVAGQRPHVVLISDEMNAGVTALPRLGIFGWDRRYLVLGLPLLSSVSPDELRAILAHEFGHVVGEDGRFGAWICRVRATWARLMDSFQRRPSWGVKLFSGFLEWWWPRFQAWSFVLARAQEYRADQLAARVAGTRVAADALVRVDLAARRLSDDFWPRIRARAIDGPQPALGPFALMTTSLRAEGTASNPQGLLRAFLAQQTDSGDTHPALVDRCRALAADPRVPPPLDLVAADTLLGPLAKSIADDFDAKWRVATAVAWREEHERLITRRNELAVLDAESARRELSQDEILERACLVEDLSGREAARSLYEQALARDPSHAAALFHAARIRLEDEDESGLALMEDLISRHDAFTKPACEAMFAYMLRQGRRDEAESWRRRYRERKELEAKADEERGEFWKDLERYQEHGLPEDVVSRIHVILDHEPEAQLAVLVGRRLQVLPQNPAWLLAIIRKRSSFETSAKSTHLDGELVERLLGRLELPGSVLICIASFQHAALVEKLAAKFPSCTLLSR